MDPVLAAEIEAIVNRTVRTALGELMQSSTRTSTGVTYPVLGDMADQDIMAIAYIVMMEAMKSAQEDLKAIMAHVKAINATKAALRCLVSKVGRDLVANDPHVASRPSWHLWTRWRSWIGAALRLPLSITLAQRQPLRLTCDHSCSASGRASCLAVA